MYRNVDLAYPVLNASAEERYKMEYVMIPECNERKDAEEECGDVVEKKNQAKVKYEKESILRFQNDSGQIQLSVK